MKGNPDKSFPTHGLKAAREHYWMPTLKIPLQWKKATVIVSNTTTASSQIPERQVSLQGSERTELSNDRAESCTGDSTESACGREGSNTAQPHSSRAATAPASPRRRDLACKQAALPRARGIEARGQARAKRLSSTCCCRWAEAYTTPGDGRLTSHPRERPCRAPGCGSAPRCSCAGYSVSRGPAGRRTGTP